MNGALFAAAVHMMAPLMFLVGGLVLAGYVCKKHLHQSGAGSARRLVKVLGSTPLGIKKQIFLVEVPGAVLVVGATAETITLLATLEKEEVEIRAKEGRHGEPLQSFAEHLQGLTSLINKNAPLFSPVTLWRPRKAEGPAEAKAESTEVWQRTR